MGKQQNDPQGVRHQIILPPDLHARVMNQAGSRNKLTPTIVALIKAGLGLAPVPISTRLAQITDALREQTTSILMLETRVAHVEAFVQRTAPEQPIPAPVPGEPPDLFDQDELALSDTVPFDATSGGQ